MKKFNTLILSILLLLCIGCSQQAPPDTNNSSVAKPQQNASSDQAETYVKEENIQTDDKIPEYSGQDFIPLNDNVPIFSQQELTATAYEKYGELDSLGRVTTAVATLGRETMPKKGEKRGDISKIKPTGWVQKQYDNVNSKWLYNRCHLIGWQLSAENDNRKNLITGTRYFNTEVMLPFENMVADYIKETGNHVAFRVTPVFDGDNLLCKGVQIEAFSVEDGGEGVCFNVFCYNTQPGITIDYKTGESAPAAGLSH